MTRIAIISDIHANLHALRAVMQDLKSRYPEQVIVAGDIVGRGPQSRETLELVIAQGWTTIKGNHEDFWVQCAHGNTPSGWDDGWWLPTRLQIDGLASGCIDWMEQLPFQHIIEIPDMPAIQVVHGSPRRLNEGLYFHDTERQLVEALNGTAHPIVVGAHTHTPLNRHAGRYWVLNCGSVGAPFNGNPAAQYLLLTGQSGAWQADFRQVRYDYKAALQYWHTSGYWDSGVAAQVFAYELETATFHFWHYVRYCKANQLHYNRQNSFTRYQEEFPQYRRFCQEHNLPLEEAASMVRFREAIGY